MVGDRVWLKVSPLKVVMMFEKKGQLNPRYIDPFEILAIVEEVGYRLALSSNLSSVHPMFHVFML